MHSLQANTRFLSNVVRSTLSHNERVEHVGMVMRACGNMDKDDGREIEVFDPRGTFSSSRNGTASAANTNAPRVTVVQRGAKQIPASTGAAATAGSLESEARKLIAAFEGSAFGAEASSVPVSNQVRTVRGRGRTMAAKAGIGARSGVAADANIPASVQRTSSGGTFPVGSVAASHLHTPAQRAEYQQTRDKYRRARGVTLLHHIAKVYGIDILIRPAGSPTPDEAADADAEGEGEDANEGAVQTVTPAGALRRTVSTPLNGAAAATAVTHSSGIAATAAHSDAAVASAAGPNTRPSRTFSTALAPPSGSGQPVSSRAHVGSNRSLRPSPPGTSSIPRDGGEGGGTTQAAASSPPPAAAVSASAAKVTFRRTFDTSLAAAPSVSALGVVPAAAAAAAVPIVRKVVSLKSRSDSGASSAQTMQAHAVASSPVTGFPLSSESAASSAALSSRPSSSDSPQPTRLAVQLSRKRKVDDAAGDSHTAAAAPSRSASAAHSIGTTPATNAPRSTSTAHASSASASATPLAKRKRTGGILGAALRDVVNAARS